MTKPSPAFKNILNQSSNRQILSPLLLAILKGAKFPKRFEVVFEDAGGPRKPDGYFHPSTHPTMNERQLYYYLTDPDRWESEVLDYESRMSVTMGTAVHSLIETMLHHNEIMVPLVGTCPACKRPHGTKKGECYEYGAADETLGSRGHMDGVIHLDTPGVYWVPGQGGLEFKTTNPRTLSSIQPNDLEAFRRKWPVYYGQVQDYMRMSGLRQFIVLFLALGYPWTPLEFQVPYDEKYAMAIEKKYSNARRAVLLGEPPDACCGIGSPLSKSCPARYVCPIGIASRP